MIVKEPKYVGKAKMFCVTVLAGDIAVKGRTKQSQQVHFFSTKDEAEQFYKSKI
jgi:hypothetical protein